MLTTNVYSWELCTLFSFTSMDSALQRIQIEPITDTEDREKSTSQFVEALCNFTYKEAHCYDPNEETKILSAIEAVGGSRFDRRIHAMGELLLQQQDTIKRDVTTGLRVTRLTKARQPSKSIVAAHRTTFDQIVISDDSGQIIVADGTAA